MLLGTAALLVCAGVSCGVALVIGVASWCMWPLRRDGLVKPGAGACRLAQSAVLASAGALCWWALPCAACVWWCCCRRRRRAVATLPPARTYSAATILRELGVARP
jgi:hypothetical protein